MISNSEVIDRKQDTLVETLTVKTLTDADCQMELEQWNQTQTSFPEDLCIHQLFEAQVEQTPNAIAVLFEEQTLTYQQLNQRANQVAHYLQTLGVGADVLVGIYLDRSIEMIVGVLGVLKAEGAYVPLDPASPADRLTFILEDTQISVILTQQALAASLPPHGAKVICLDANWDIIADHSQENPGTEITVDQLIYVIYTSGSTGRPKGVMIHHRGIYNQLYWRQTTFPLTVTDRVLQTISFSFDPSVWQIFWPLSFGAQLVVPRPGGHQDSAYLAELIAQRQITVIALVPSMLRVFLEEKTLDQCRGLKHVFCGGEALPLDLQEQFFARLTSENLLHNVYGPTEASIDATFWTCQPGTNYRIAPIGRPIANTQIYILDAHLQPVAAGESGELHIGGVGLARGYLNRPELTEAKFIPHPYSNEPDARLYKTGDLARYLPDGNIEFLGRIDDQVKVRGFRIELGEIESALNQHPAVRQSVAIAREDQPGDKRLVAYIVPQNQALTVSEIRRFLKEKLPEYMVPAAFVMLATLPLNANGKIDRRALPIPESERPELEHPFVAAQTPVELELTQIWQQVLSLQPIGIKDNFFELGGNSLLAARLLAQIEETFHKKLPLSTFFQTPTIEQLSRLLQQDEWQPAWESLVAIQPNGAKPPVYCVHGIGGNVFSYYQLASYLGNEQPFYGLQARGLDGKHLPHDRIEDIAADYLKEIQALQPLGPYLLCGYSFGGIVAYEMAQQLVAQGQQVAMLALLDTYHPAGWFKPLPRHIRFRKHLRNLWQLDLRNKLTYIQEKLSRGKPWNNQLEMSESNPLETIHKQAARKYRPQAYSGRGLLLRAAEPPEEWLTWLQLVEPDPQLGWGQLFAEGLEVQDVSGSHINMLNEPNVKDVATKLQAALEAAHSHA